jgi:hypothetical protein
MAFTVTMLAWSTVEFQSQLEAKNELSNALDAIKWGTDYFIKAHPQPYVLYGEVGDGDSDHSCWERPEEMTTPRTTFKLMINTLVLILQLRLLPPSLLHLLLSNLLTLHMQLN